MTKWKIVAICGTVLLIAAAVVVALRERLQPVPLPEVSVAASPAEVRVKAVERKAEPVEQHIWTLFASHAHLRVKSAADEPVASSLGEGGNLGVAGAGRWFRTRCRRS